MGLKEGIKLIDGIEGIEAIFIMGDKRIYTTDGIKGNFKLFNKDYIYENKYILE